MWAQALSAANAFMDQHGGSRLRKVEGGITGMLNAHLPIGGGYQTVQSIKPHVRIEQQLAGWDQPAQDAFLLRLLNAVRTAFGQPVSTAEDVLKLIHR